MAREHYKAFRKDGWPLCPNCGDDELYDSVVWVGDGPRPTVEQSMASTMKCYRCSWASDAPGVGCWHCKGAIETRADGRKYIYCAKCREHFRAETVRKEIDDLDWPEVIGE